MYNIMYEVKVFHFKSCVRRGDLEEEYVLESATTYKTRKAAKDSIEAILNRKDKKQVRREYHRGNSRCFYFPGYIWQNENSGEKKEEYYEYQLNKVIPKK